MSSSLHPLVIILALAGIACTTNYDPLPTAGASATEPSTTTTMTTTTDTMMSSTTGTTEMASDSDSMSSSSSSTGGEPTCGNGKPDDGEDCDDGDENGMYGKCKTDCTGLGEHCGDEKVNGPETCDLGAENGNYGSECNDTCDGPAAKCGDGEKDEQEECDDGNNDDNDACLSTCLQAMCGDGVIQDEVEECDDAENNGEGNACSAECHKERIVFATAEKFYGDLSTDDTINNLPNEVLQPGLPRADIYCQTLATNAGLAGTYRAWLSDSNSSPATRFVAKMDQVGLPDDFSGRFVLTNGTTIIANSWGDLTKPSGLSKPISTDQNNDGASGAVWTGTGTDGKATSPNCGDWSTQSDTQSGTQGSAAAVDKNWTAKDQPSTCDNDARLYCFQVSLTPPPP